MCVQTPSIESMDMDLDLELMQKFSCLGITDNDMPISEFQRLLSFQFNQAGCTFLLDMTNWNLQAAIGAYYEFQSPNISVPSMSFVEDVTIGEGESIPPDTQFIKLGSRILGQRPCLREFALNMLGETCEHGDGEITRAPRDRRCQRLDVEPQQRRKVPGTVADVHCYRTLVWRCHLSDSQCGRGWSFRSNAAAVIF